MKRGQGFDATTRHFYEAPLGDPDYLEVWCYTDQLSYQAGERVDFHLSTTADIVSLEILRDGGTLTTVHENATIVGNHYDTPEDFFENGCAWPVGYSWRIPVDQMSGFYMVVCKVRNENGEEREHEAGFFVRPTTNRANILLIAATCTWTAYNDWGGVSNYVGHSSEFMYGKSPRLSIQRPWAKGFISLPGGAPRKPHQYATRPGDIPRYPPIEFAYTRGYSKWYANAGWASYERLFSHWAENQGYRLDYASQHDLHFRPDLIGDYDCVVMVGHDEYWTREMREAIERYVENGGNFARFGGNFCWQIRLEDDGRTQVCYKEDAHEKDPVSGTEDSARLTSFWEDPKVGWSGAQTVGLNGLYGIYAGVGHIAPRQGGSFTVYRPEHWVFNATDLCYGDQFGGEAKIFGYEVDGLDYTILDGLPEPTYRDGAVKGTQILAMGLAGNWEADHGNKGTVRYYAGVLVDIEELMTSSRYGEVTEETKAAATRGSGMIIHFHRGKGQVFNAGTCEWVAGLKLGDTETETITRNVLDRFCHDDQNRK
jgi:hypothetical protein